ncbi:MAG TPA: hypothetical protein PKN04_03490 [bacterium]|mgnify:CR=1 FL=1|nr:hypothetical protein [bacterium]HNT64819.1 hypothetical protein [bacterium]HOX85013.1 hypothetical protein [bacterium]HPG44121.1 hypothetical protein [bacterium]HPM96488.1 hypothetical protein [bacterium]
MRYHLLLALSIVIWLLTAGGALTADLTPEKAALAKSALPDNSGPIVEDDWKFQNIGTMWTRVTNFSYMGDDAYEGRTPSGDWPGGSGNSYLYRGTLWLSATVDGVFHSTQGDDHEFAPIDSVHVITGPEARSEQDTWTRFYDVSAPLATNHFPLGLEVTERSFAWSASYADDFIIYEWTVKNVGIDSDGDGYPDTPRDLQDFYFTFRLDGDVSKLPNWDAEYRFSNQDDHVLSNATPWDEWLPLFPQMAGRDHHLTPEQCDSTMVFMWDGDNPSYPADNGQADDFANPGPDGKLQTPGFLAIKVLKSVPYLKPSSFQQCNIYNDPGTDLEAFTRMIGKKAFEGVVISGGKPFPYDYRGIMTFGPLPTLAYGDSVVLTAALGVGCDPDSGGVYSLQKLVEIMGVAQFIVDTDYTMSTAAMSPATPAVRVEPYLENGIADGVKLIWDNASVDHEYFAGYKVWKSTGTTATGEYAWQPLGLGVYAVDDAGSWPPPAGDEPNTFQLIDRDVINGLDYYYSVQAYTVSIEQPIPLGVVETNVLNSLKYISPANPVAKTLDNVKAVPNPYIGSARWNNALPSDANPWQHRLQFINLPADATIKIFTLDGDFVDEIHAGESVRRGTQSVEGNTSVAEWDLITRNDQEAAPGLYLFVVDSPSLGQTTGKFVIIR